MSLIVAPPVACAGEPMKPLRKRKRSTVSIFLAVAMGTWTRIKRARVARYTLLRPMLGASDRGDQTIGPVAYPRIEMAVPSVAMEGLMWRSWLSEAIPGEKIEAPR